MKRCPVCGAAGQTCGGPTTMPGVDERVTTAAPPGAPLQRYLITHPDGTTSELLLDAAHAAITPTAVLIPEGA